MEAGRSPRYIFKTTTNRESIYTTKFPNTAHCRASGHTHRYSAGIGTGAAQEFEKHVKITLTRAQTQLDNINIALNRAETQLDNITLTRAKLN